MKRATVMLVMSLAVLLVPSTASAQSGTSTTGAASSSEPTTKSPSTAKDGASRFVDALLSRSPGHAPWCDTKTRSGFLARRTFYLASCATNDGTFQFFTVVSARNVTLKQTPPYYQAQLAKFCSTGGHAYVTGIRGQFVNTYAGTGAGQTVAVDLAVAAGNGFRSAKEYVAPAKLC
jgi:hypothetical protein